MSPLITGKNAGGMTLTPKRPAKQQRKATASPMIPSNRPFNKNSKLRDKSATPLLNQPSKEEKDISIFRKKKIKTLKPGGKASKKQNKNKNKPFPEIHSVGSFDSLKSGGIQNNFLDIPQPMQAKDSARSEMDKYLYTKHQIAKHNSDNKVMKSIMVDPLSRVQRRNKKRVAFRDVSEYREGEEEAIITRNRKKYKKDRDMVNIHRLKKKLHKIQIKPNDPILFTPYPKYYLADQVEKKKFQTELEVCRIHVNDLRVKGINDKQRLKVLQEKYQKRNPPQDVEDIYNSSLGGLKKSIKFSDRSMIQITYFF